MPSLVNILRNGCFIVLMGLVWAGCSKSGGGSAVGEEASLIELNRALTSWGIMNSGPAPKTISDLTNSPALKGKRLPTPPPGKKLAIDFAKRQVVIVDE